MSQTEIKKKFILDFSEISRHDVSLVGGKNAALGELIRNLKKLQINVPDGFAVTAPAYRHFLREAGLERKIKDSLKNLDTANLPALREVGAAVRNMILAADFPEDLRSQITASYRELGRKYRLPNPDAAIRSSATAEDLPDASFAGQQETYLNVRGERAVTLAVKKCFASLFTDRAISYRADKGFSHFEAALSVGVQKMARSDLGASGVMFTLDTETGFDRVVVVNAIYGLGEMIVQGQITPDEFVVFKPALEQGYRAILEKKLGRKIRKLVYDARNNTKAVSVSLADQQKFALSDAEALKLSRWGMAIERHFGRGMDIEWAKDGRTKKLYIVQARPETVHSAGDKTVYRSFRLTKNSGKILLTGTAVGTKIATGRVRFIPDPARIAEFRAGEILVTDITDPDWEPIMKMAAGIVTNKGGRTSHAAIVSRELGIPAIVGTGLATKILKNSRLVTVDCSSGDEGRVFAGKLPFTVAEHRLAEIPKTRTKVMVNIGSPEEAFKNHFLPVRGVGLGRLEFIIASAIKIHPQALIDFAKLKEGKALREIRRLTKDYADKSAYYIDKLASGIAKIGAAFWPHEVIIRFSDFKSNEYRKLLGGEVYEPSEENPMLGFRGASRYYDPKFARAFSLECRALRTVRDVMGLKNVVPMIPFCRTPEEGRRVLALMQKNGLSRARDKSLKVYVMCEIPSNVILAEEFLKIFDGMSIGSNDLTQLVLGLDRDSGIVSGIGNENNEAVKTQIARAIAACKRAGKYIGICGQAPSDYPEFVKFLLKHKIESISLNPDTVIPTILKIAQYEKKL